MQLLDGCHNELVGASAAFRAVCAQIGQAAPTDCTVLIQGESGTGKELVARALHENSRRGRGALVKVNCAALPEALLESELFGHVRGAFTGAVRDRKGRFAEAEGGTILLDEIASLPRAGQAKLLRVLQEKEFEPVGSSTSRKVDVRIIAADNHDLGEAVRAGAFREDLFYRLNVFPMLMPPLRERREDLPLLLEHFLRKHAHLKQPVISAASPCALEAIMQYHWPGNVRELENAVQHALIVETAPTIRATSLPFRVEARANPFAREMLSLRERLRLCEKHALHEALVRSNGVKKRAAHALGVDPKNMSYLLRKHGL